MTGPRLTPEQRRALAMLATAGRDGATQALLSAHGFDASMIAGLVNRGLRPSRLKRFGRRKADCGRQGADHGGGAGRPRRRFIDFDRNDWPTLATRQSPVDD